jgi:hypothetical protein
MSETPQTPPIASETDLGIVSYILHIWQNIFTPYISYEKARHYFPTKNWSFLIAYYLKKQAQAPIFIFP